MDLGGLGLRQPHRGDLGLAEGHLGDQDVIDRGRVQARDLLRHDDALGKAAVGELDTGDDVTHGPHARDVGAAVLVGQDETAVHGDPDLLVAEVGGRRSTAHGDEEDLGLMGLAVLGAHGHPAVVALDRLEHRVGAEGDLALAEGALELLGDRLVLVGHQVGQPLDDGDLAAHGGPGRGELHPDDAAAQDHCRGGDVVHLQGLQTSPPLDQVDAPRGHQALQALVHPRDDAVLVLLDARHVHALEGGLDAHRGGLAHGSGGLGGVQQGLGGHAAAVEAGAPQLVRLDDGDLEAQLGATQGGGVAP